MISPTGQPTTTFFSVNRALNQNHKKSDSEKMSVRTKISFVDLVFMNASITVFSIYFFQELVDNPLISYARWGILGLWSLFLLIRPLLFKFKPKPKPPLPTSGKLCGFMLVWLLFTIINSTNPINSLQKWGAMVMLFVFGYFLIRRSYANTNFGTLFVTSICIQALFFSVWGLTLVLLKEPGIFGVKKFSGVFYRTGAASYFPQQLFYIGLGLFTVPNHKLKATRCLSFLVAFLSIILIYATGSRSGFISSLGVAVIWFLFILIKRYRNVFLVLTVLVCIWQKNNIVNWFTTAEVFRRRTEDILTGRTPRYEEQVRLFLNNPLMGTGFASGPSTRISGGLSPEVEESTRSRDHSAYLGAFVETGIIGGLLFLAWVICVVYEAFKFAKHQRTNMVAQYAFMLIVSAILISFVESLLFGAGNVLILLFYIVCGIIGIERGGVGVSREPNVNVCTRVANRTKITKC